MIDVATPLELPAGATPVVSVKNVSAAYGKVPVLYDISFDIHALCNPEGTGGNRSVHSLHLHKAEPA